MQQQTIICKKCGKKYILTYPFESVWENGDLECDCETITEFENELLKTLFI